MSAKLTLKGFDSYIKKLKGLNADVKKVGQEAIGKSVVMFNGELVKQVNASPMSQETKDRMMQDLIKPEVNHVSDNLIIGDAGFRIGDDYHDSHDDKLSGGFIALFNEYGTEGRFTKRKGYRGSLEKMEFTKRTHRKVDSKIRKLQEEVLTKAIKEAGL